MKIMRGLFFTSILFFWSLTAAAQSNEQYLVKVRDYVNARVTYLMLNEFVKHEKVDREKWDSLMELLNSNSAKKVLTYAELERGLSNGFTLTDTKLSKLISKIDLEQYENFSADSASAAIIDAALQLLKRSYAHIYGPIASYRSTLVNEVQELLRTESVSQPTTGVKSDTIVTDVTPVDQLVSVESKSGFFSLDYFTFWVALSLLLSFAAIGLATSKRKKYHSKYRQSPPDRTWTEDKSQSLEWIQMQLQQHKENTEARIAALNAKLEAVSHSRPKADNYQKDESRYISQATDEKDTSPEIFYMSSPSNNYFPMSAKSIVKENTLYRFIPQGNEKEAEFEVINDGAPITQAAYHSSSYFEPACNAENSPDNVVTHITTTRRGKASYDGEKWIITQKAEIRYE